MVNLILFLLIFSMTLLQNYIMSAVSHPMYIVTFKIGAVISSSPSYSPSN